MQLQVAVGWCKLAFKAGLCRRGCRVRRHHQTTTLCVLYAAKQLLGRLGVVGCRRFLQTAETAAFRSHAQVLKKETILIYFKRRGVPLKRSFLILTSIACL